MVYKQIVLPIKLLIIKPDYLICSDYVAPIISFYTKKITVIHDSLFWDYPENYNFWWRKYYILLIKLGIYYNTHIVTTSNISKKKLERIFYGKKITYIYQSFYMPKNLNESILNKYKIKSKKYLFHVSSFDKRKDIITLIKAFNLIKKEKYNIKLVLAGEQILNGNRAVINEINNYIILNDLTNDIILTGFISKQSVAEFFQNALIYVFPSKDEGFGIPILEALSFSIPTICSNIEVFKEIGNNSVEFFKAGDPNSLAKKITFLINDEDAREKLIKNGLEHIKKFNRKNFIKGFEEFILNE